MVTELLFFLLWKSEGFWCCTHSPVFAVVSVLDFCHFSSLYWKLALLCGSPMIYHISPVFVYHFIVPWWDTHACISLYINLDIHFLKFEIRPVFASGHPQPWHMVDTVRLFRYTSIHVQILLLNFRCSFFLWSQT